MARMYKRQDLNSSNFNLFIHYSNYREILDLLRKAQTLINSNLRSIYIFLFLNEHFPKSSQYFSFFSDQLVPQLLGYS